MKKEMTVEIVLISPVTANELLNTCSVAYQRRLRDRHVDHLEKLMKSGDFESNTIVIAEVEKTGKRFLLNGQHTLYAISSSGCTISLPVQTYIVEDEDDIPPIYASLDKQNKRTPSDTYRAYALADELGITDSALNRYSACAGFMLNGLKRENAKSIITESERIEFMRSWIDSAKKYWAAIENSSQLRTLLERREVFAVGLITCKYSNHAHEFWHGVATDDGLKIGDPRKTLRGWLEDTALTSSGFVSKNKRRVVGVSTALRSVVLAWNSYVEGKQLKVIIVKNPSLPFTIKGTPYKNIE
jgi:hypothetical protein